MPVVGPESDDNAVYVARHTNEATALRAPVQGSALHAWRKRADTCSNGKTRNCPRTFLLLWPNRARRPRADPGRPRWLKRAARNAPRRPTLTIEEPPFASQHPSAFTPMPEVPGWEEHRVWVRLRGPLVRRVQAIGDDLLPDLGARAPQRRKTGPQNTTQRDTHT